MPNADARRVRRASLSVGLYVAAASVLILLVAAGLLVATIVARSRPEGRPRPPGSPWQSETRWPGPIEGVWVVEVNHLMVVLVVVCLVGVVLLGLTAWLAARRAVAPLSQALELQRHFVADAAHELRTPLTVLDSRVQVLGRRLERGHPVGSTLAELRRDTDRMRGVLDDLLLAAEGAAQSGSDQADLAQAAGRAIDSLDLMAQQRNVKIILTIREASQVALAASSLERAIVALVDNAIQHSPAGGQVEVDCQVERSQAVLRVRDQGPGLAGVDPERVFERFAHGPESGGRRGFGLGLALANEIAGWAGGDLAVESSSSAGAVFALRLPLAGTRPDRPLQAPRTGSIPEAES
ncbi:MAG: HAMP domain-containing histidine kinase [Propionibacteriaceae bacterium]|jgi:signal transduction histidine kinase|nr:HAMP domain-containing histidine kinase [Propionibacteriaceae bacterium]